MKARSIVQAYRAPAIVALALLVAACASQPGKSSPGRSSNMVTGGESGLGISGADTPMRLKAIAAAPYRLSAPPDCSALAHEVDELDGLLGPDVDILADPKARTSLNDQAGHALGSAVRGALPYRWVLRWMTQAGRLDRELRLAILAGTARRGYLKGMRSAMGCGAPASPQALVQR